MSTLLAIDPGKHRVGLALFLGETLAHAELSGGLGGQPDLLLEAVEPLEITVASIVEQVGKIDTLVIEKPQVYDNQRQKGRQTDIVDLAIVVGAIIRGLKPFTVGCLKIHPAQWKGQVAKEVMVRRIQSKLSEQERGTVELPSKSLEHNVWDAVGIGLWRLGRLGK